MRSQAEGVGCDDTRDVFREVRPVVDVVPSAERDYRRTHPWLVFEGRWGERQAAFFNGPTGPNMKTQWTRPVTWARQDWRPESFTVPTGGPIGPQATDIFCGAVAFGSETLRRAKSSPPLTVAIVGGIAVLLLWGLSRTEWRPATRRLRGRRAWGQVVASAWRIYRDRPRLWMGIGLVFVPLGLVTTIGQWLIFRVSGLSLLVDEAGERNAFVASLAVGFGLLVSLLGFAVVQAATARALREIEAGREVTPLGAYRALRNRVRPLVAALAVAVPVQVLLDLTVVLVPVAVFLLVRWSLIGVLAGLDDVDRPGLLPRSVALVRRHWWRTATLGLGVTAVGLLLGPLVGTLALLISSASFDLINIVSALVYVAALPFPAIVMTLLAGDLAARAAEVEAGAAVERDDEAVASA
jgi:hypothetical protein